MVTTSQSLLERFRRSDADAWALFVDLYSPLLHRWAWRLGLQDADADDLVQEVFGILLQKLPEFEYDRGRSFRGWLRTIMVHRWRNWPRRRPESLIADLPGSDPGDDVQEEEYRCFLVGRALKIMQTDFELPTWRACWESVVNGRPAADVASDLGMSVAAVYIARSRVLRRLRDELRGMIEE